MLLSDMGADGVRVLRPNSAPEECTGTFTRRGRTAVVADLKDPAQRSQVLELCDRADVLIEGLRPGVTERLGLGPDDLLRRNARLVYARMTGWGQWGPMATTVGHDINYISLTGALHAVGPASTPVPPLNLVGDYGGGSMLLVSAVLAALFERERSGLGQVLDVAMIDGVAALIQPILELRSEGRWSDGREENLLDGAAPFYRTYECGDGKHVAVGAIEPQFYAELLRVLELSDESLPGQLDRDRWPELADTIGAMFQTRPRDEWAKIFEGTDSCVTPVLTFAEAPRHPHVAARRSLVEAEQGVTAGPSPCFRGSSPTRPADRTGSVKELSAVVEEWSA